MQRIEGLTEPQLLAFEAQAEALMSASLQAVMDAIADRIAAIKTASILVAAGADAPPPPEPELPPGQPYVSPDDLAAIGPAWEEQVANQLLPMVAQVFMTSGGSIHAGLVDATGITELPSVSSLAAEQYLAQAQATFDAVQGDLWLTARDQLLEGFQEGESIPQLAQRLRDTPGMVEPSARLVARTQVNEASNAGSIAVARASGLDMRKVWIATMDLRTRPTHLQADRTTNETPIDLHDPFMVGGFPAQYPASSTLPPSERYNCRCTIGYVLSDRDIQDARRDVAPEAPLPNTTPATVDDLAAELHGQVEQLATNLRQQVESTFAEVEQRVRDLGIPPVPPPRLWGLPPERAGAELQGMTVTRLRAMAQERGLPIPPGARKADLIKALSQPVDERAARAALRARQAAIEARTPTARLLSELDRDIGVKAEDAAIREHLNPALWPGVDQATLTRLTAAYERGGASALKTEVAAISRAEKVKPIGAAGRTMAFDEKTMRSVADVDIPAGTQVTVVQRGSSITLPSGETVQIEPALVTTVRPAKKAARQAAIEARTPTAHLLAELDRDLALAERPSFGIGEAMSFAPEQARVVTELDRLVTSGARDVDVRAYVTAQINRGDLGFGSGNELLAAIDSADRKRVREIVGVLKARSAPTVPGGNPVKAAKKAAAKAVKAPAKVAAPKVPAVEPYGTVRATRPFDRFGGGEQRVIADGQGGYIGQIRERGGEWRDYGALGNGPTVAHVLSGPYAGTGWRRIAAPRPAVKAPAKVAAPKPKPVPAPERMPVASLRMELSRAGIPAEMTQDLPKSALADWVRTVREPGRGGLADAARIRQQVIDHRKALGDALGDALEAVGHDASPRALQSLAKAIRAQHGAGLGDWPEAKTLDALVTAMESGDAKAVTRAATTAARRHGLTVAGGRSGEVVNFDRSTMDVAGGGRIAPGARVVVQRPGYEVTVNGERLTITRPKVVEAPPEVAPVAPRLKAKKLRGLRGTPAKKASAKRAAPAKKAAPEKVAKAPAAKKAAPPAKAPAKKAPAKKATPAKKPPAPKKTTPTEPDMRPVGTGKVGPKARKLPKVQNPDDARAQAMAANPRAGRAYEGETTAYLERIGGASYASTNCTRVAITYEMRRRGVAVTAGAATERGDSVVAYVRAFRQEGRYAVRLADDLGRNMSIRDIAREVQSWPRGARGIVTVQGHTFNVECDAVTGRAIFIDAQTASSRTPVMDAAALIRRLQARGVPVDRSCAVGRVDDLDFSDYGLRYVESPELRITDGQVLPSQYPSPDPDVLRFPKREELANMEPDDSYP